MVAQEQVAALDRQQQEHLDAQGYLVLEGVLSPSDEAYAEATPELKRLYGFTAWPQPADGPGVPKRRL